MNYKSPMNNQNKGYGGESASQERSNLLNVNPLSKHMSTPMQMGGSKMKGSAMMMKEGPGDGGKKAAKKAKETLKKGLKSGAIKKGRKKDAKTVYKGSPAKNLGMKYDIKEASNQSLSKSARKHYAENAQAASKSGYKG
jgi:hypothetical protein